MFQKRPFEDLSKRLNIDLLHFCCISTYLSVWFASLVGRGDLGTVYGLKEFLCFIFMVRLD